MDTQTANNGMTPLQTIPNACKLASQHFSNSLIDLL